MAYFAQQHLVPGQSSHSSVLPPQAPKSLLDRINVPYVNNNISKPAGVHRHRASSSTSSETINHSVNAQTSSSSGAPPDSTPASLIASPVSVAQAEEFLDNLQRDLARSSPDGSEKLAKSPSSKVVQHGLMLPPSDRPSPQSIPGSSQAYSLSNHIQNTNMKNTVLLAISRNAQRRSNVRVEHVSSSAFKSASEAAIAEKGPYASLLESLTKAGLEIFNSSQPKMVSSTAGPYSSTVQQSPQQTPTSEMNISENLVIPRRRSLSQDVITPPQKRRRFDTQDFKGPTTSNNTQSPIAPIGAKGTYQANGSHTIQDEPNQASVSGWRQPVSNERNSSVQGHPVAPSDSRVATHDHGGRETRAWGKASAPLGPARPPPKSPAHVRDRQRSRGRSSSPARDGHILPSSNFSHDSRNRGYSPRPEYRDRDRNQTSRSPLRRRRGGTRQYESQSPNNRASRSVATASPTAHKLPYSDIRNEPIFSYTTPRNISVNGSRQHLRTSDVSPESLQSNASLVAIKSEPVEEMQIQSPLSMHISPVDLANPKPIHDTGFEGIAMDTSPSEGIEGSERKSAPQARSRYVTGAPQFVRPANPSNDYTHSELASDMIQSFPSQLMETNTMADSSHSGSVAISSDTTPRPVVAASSSVEIRTENNTFFLDGRTPGLWIVHTTAPKACVQEISLVLDHKPELLDLKLLCLDVAAAQAAFDVMGKGVEEVMTRIMPSEHEWSNSGSLILQLKTDMIEDASGRVTGTNTKSWLPKDFREKEPLDFSPFLKKGRNTLKVIQLRPIPDRIIVLAAIPT